MKQNNDLFEAFDTVSDEQWQHAIERFLKGKPLTHLNWEVEEGVAISPLQRHATTVPVGTGWESAQGGNQWRLAEAVVVHNSTDIPQANALLLNALTKGADALHIKWYYCPSSSDLEQLFQGVLLDLVSLHFDATSLQTTDFLPSFSNWTSAQKTQGSLALAITTTSELWPLIAPELKQLTWRWLNFGIDTTKGQTLSKALYQASLWMDFLLENGYKSTQIVQWMRFEYAIEQRYFVALARVRAFKRCWLALLKGYDSKTVWPWLHAYTVNTLEADQYRNMLVGTTQAMSAVLAGVDSLLVQPSNGMEQANDFTRRIARNMQHLLQAESYMNRVVDPAAGAYYIEHLTKELTERTWQQFCTF